LRLLRAVAIFSILLLTAPLVMAQGTTGALTGTVTSNGSPLPGVTVSVTSPALQGMRMTSTGEAGGYNFPALPPGQYDVRFELSGMQTLTKRARVELATTARTDADLKVSSVAESVTVTATAPSVLETPQAATTFDAKTIDELPVTRTIASTTLLSPGVNDAGPNNQITISGAQSFDNLFLVNGVVVNENLRGQPMNLFIEDAIQETTVLRGAISAEYGRFTGGVVTTLTKSGGNEFTGSLRDTLTNDNWRSKTPFAGEADHSDTINNVYEGTFGGRIIRDRLWFFLAGRKQDITSTATTYLTNIGFPQNDKRQRYETKLTGQLFKGHDVVGSYISSKATVDNYVSTTRIVDLRSLTTRREPNTLLSLHYSGLLTNNLLAEAQFSRMNYSFSFGAETRDLIDGTLLLDATIRPQPRGWSPTFCGSICPPKQRDNKSMLLKSSYYLSTGALGNHSFVGGYEEFHQLRNENNFQSGSDFRIHGNFFFNGTTLLFGVDPENSEIEWDPVPALSKTSDFAVRSLFFNDKWDLTTRWSFNAGLRYDKDSGKDQAGNKTVDDSAFSPRLSATYDIGGTGRHRVTANYARYVSKVDQGPADNTAAAGRYASYYWDYKGPLINPKGTPLDQMLPVPEVIKRVFDWFNSVGGTKNTSFLTDSNIPGTTSKFEHSLRAPHMDEQSLGYGFAFGPNGFVRADVLHRSWKDFYVVRRTRNTGTAVDPNGTIFDVGVIENASSGLSRKYNGLQLQGAYRLLNMINLGGNYTYSKLRGNVEGEQPSFATTFTDFHNYPEYTDFTQNNPVGFLNEDMRHRANLWADYNPHIGFGEFTVSVLERYHSGLPYSASSTIDVRNTTSTGPGANGVANPGYQRPPTSVAYFFSDRGAFRLDAITSTDLALRYTIPVVKVGVTFLGDVVNVFNEHGIEDPDFVTQTVLTRRNGAKLPSGNTAVAFNPFKETPVYGVNWEKSATFGRPNSADAYQTARYYRLAVRVRF
jgi:carboxypeptidase family protein/TonB-dependent receptor-like protein